MAADIPAPMVFILDDDAGLAHLVKKVLHREGFAVATARSGEEAIAWLSFNRADLMLLDLNLHDIEGKELVNSLADTNRLPPFIIITGQGDERTAVDMMKRGALDYLIKDVDFLQFVPEVVRRALVRVARERRLAQAENQARLSQTVIEQGYSATLITSAETTDPKIIYVNPAFTRLTGFRANTLVGKRFSQLEALTGQWQPFRTALTNGKSFLCEAQIRRPRGEPRIAECHSIRVFDQAGQQSNWAFLLQDVTERKQNEVRQKLQYETALVLAEAGSAGEAAPKILKAVCEAFGWESGELWSVDEEAKVLRNVCTWPPGEMASPSWASATAQCTFPRGSGLPGRVWDSRRPAYIANIARDCDCRRRTLAKKAGIHSGFAFPIVLHQEVLGVMAFLGREVRPLMDGWSVFFTSLGSQIGQFVERKRAEDALRRSEANLARAQQIAHLGSYVINIAGTEGSHWSAESARILGLDPSSKDLSSHDYISRIIHPDDQARVRQSFDRAIDQGASFDIEYRICRSNGTFRYVHNIAEPIFGPDRNVIKLVGTIHDITERKQLEKQVQDTSEREQRRIGRDLHDGLGQQLTAIELMCESLRTDLTSVQPDLAAHAGQVCRLLRQTIGQTRALAYGLTAFKVETGGIETALMDLVRTTSALGKLKCRFSCRTPVALKDPETAANLYRIAQEAINNAVKHSRANTVTVQLSRTDNAVRLKVADNGRGLPARRRSHGMGLHLMKHRADLIGGELEVDSRPGRGVTVTCTIRNQP